MEDIAVKVWAKQIREIKIREMEELILRKKSELSSVNMINFQSDSNKFKSPYQLKLIDELNALRSKLEILYA